MAKIIKETIHANGFDISLFTEDLKNSYISLTDIAKYRSNEPNDVIKNWLRYNCFFRFVGKFA